MNKIKKFTLKMTVLIIAFIFITLIQADGFALANTTNLTASVSPAVSSTPNPSVTEAVKTMSPQPAATPTPKVPKTEVTPKPFPETEGMQFKDSILIKMDNSTSIRVKYPVFDSDLRVVANINKLMKNQALKTYDNAVKMGELIEKDKAENSNIVGESFFYEKLLTYNPGANNKGFLSVLFTDFEYTGGAHGIYDYISYNFNAQNGKTVTLDKLFNKGYDYTGVINKAIKDLNSATKSYVMENFKTIKDSKDWKKRFYITPENKLIYYFSLYEYGPYSEGIPFFEIDPTIFGDNLSDLGKSAFAK